MEHRRSASLPSKLYKPRSRTSAPVLAAHLQKMSLPRTLFRLPRGIRTCHRASTFSILQSMVAKNPFAALEPAPSRASSFVAFQPPALASSFSAIPFFYPTTHVFSSPSTYLPSPRTVSSHFCLPRTLSPSAFAPMVTFSPSLVLMIRRTRGFVGEKSLVVGRSLVVERAFVVKREQGRACWNHEERASVGLFRRASSLICRACSSSSLHIFRASAFAHRQPQPIASDEDRGGGLSTTRSLVADILPRMSLAPKGLYGVKRRPFSEFDGLHFNLESRGTNIDGSVPVYKNPTASIEDPVADLLPRMTVQEKVAQIIQGDIYIANPNEPLDDTLAYNLNMNTHMSGSIWAGYLMPWDKLVFAINTVQQYFLENTTLVAGVIRSEAEALGYSQLFAPVLDLSPELRWGRAEANYGEDPFLTGEIGSAYVSGLQTGRRQNTSSTAIARVAATCKHSAAFRSPQSGLNIAQVSGDERKLRTNFLKPFNKACVDSLAIMTAHSSYDGIPAVSNKHLLTDIAGLLPPLIDD
uniref:Glycoside hydrolase family 3 protein n=1 Tax=Mycena chlorophos TaxID=658473 RepID=A0ABQ0LFS8_MYCCL|nr:glycoside hydrolase family 3 protein [Mycena chlorophos]